MPSKPYRPKAPSPADEPAGSGSVPFGVQLLAFLAGILFLLLAGKSVMQDARLYYKLSNLERVYDTVPATWLKVAVRRDASGSDEFYPDILFDADVNGTSVWGWRLSLEEGPADSAYWVSRLAGYRVGDTLTVYVNPRDPKDSFVEARSEGVRRVLAKTMMGGAFGLFGGTLVVLSVLGWLRKPPPGGKRKDGRQGDRKGGRAKD